MVLDYHIFLHGLQRQLKNKLALLEKVNYPTTVEGLVRLGLEQENAELLRIFIKKNGLKPRETCSLFVYEYLDSHGVSSYKGRLSLRSWMYRKGFSDGIRSEMRAICEKIIESEN